MAGYEPDKLALLASPVTGGGPQIWSYGGTDAAADVDAANYFSDATAKGVKLGDFIYAAEPDGTGAAVMRVSAISAAGAATVVDITS